LGERQPFRDRGQVFGQQPGSTKTLLPESSPADMDATTYADLAAVVRAALQNLWSYRFKATSDRCEQETRLRQVILF